MKKKVGRPQEKKNRVKIGLSLDGQYNEMLNELSILTGKTKSRLIEESIVLLYEKQKEIEEILNNSISNKNPFDTIRTMLSSK